MSNTTKSKTTDEVGSDAPTCTPLRVLRLTLKKKWFDMVASGVKKEEYRDESPWIISRLKGKKYDAVEFRNGYSPDSPKCLVEYFGWYRGYGKEEWGGGMLMSPSDPLFSAGPERIVIRLGSIISENAELSDRHE